MWTFSNANNASKNQFELAYCKRSVSVSQQCFPSRYTTSEQRCYDVHITSLYNVMSRLGYWKFLPPQVFYPQCFNFFSGKFIFSVWDDDRTYKKGGTKHIRKSSKLTWPMHANCIRNCQDCSMKSLRHLKRRGFTTGTKCVLKFPQMKVNIFMVTLVLSRQYYVIAIFFLNKHENLRLSLRK